MKPLRAGLYVCAFVLAVLQGGACAVECTDRTYVCPSEALIGGVVAACVGEIGARLRGDVTLAKFIGNP